MTPNQGPCPECNGTGRIPSNPREAIYASYDPITNTRECRNCGGQYQYGCATGVVNLRRDNGQPCVHQYKGTAIGHNYTSYTCEHCGNNYAIDSGD